MHPTLTHSSALVHDDLFLRYDFGPSHPLRPERLTLGLDLMCQAGLLNLGPDRLQPSHAADSELELIHGPSYVRAVQRASDNLLDSGELQRYGLYAGDTPAFSGMHSVASLVSGGTVDAMRSILNGSISHAFNPGGGWHHALRNRASGFCVYNDPALSAAIAAEESGARVLYADFDCHHGDGVQWIFYENPDVMTVSFHESGEYLFPGTGDVGEIGSGRGRGFSVNVPVQPFTGDSSWLHAVTSVLPAAMESFRPDVLITAHGCDTHVFDPLTHVALTTRSLVEQANVAHELAHTYCQGRWLAVGSGGYDWERVVPRSWSILWSEMTGRPLPEKVPQRWIEEHQPGSRLPLPKTFLDDPSVGQVEPASTDIDLVNDNVVALALSTVANVPRRSATF